MSELFSFSCEKLNSNPNFLLNTQIEFTPLHHFRLALKGLQRDLKDINVNELRSNEIKKEIRSLLSKKFDMAYGDYIAWFQRMVLEAKKRETRPLDAIFKLSRPIWGFIALQAFSQIMIDFLKLSHEETIWYAKFAFPIFIMQFILPPPHAVPDSIAAAYLFYVCNIIYCASTTGLNSYFSLNAANSIRILLGMYLERQILVQEDRNTTQSPELDLINSFLGVLKKHDELFGSELYEEFLENYVDAPEHDDDGEIYHDALDAPPNDMNSHDVSSGQGRVPKIKYQ